MTPLIGVAFQFFDLFVVGSQSANVGSSNGGRILWDIFF